MKDEIEIERDEQYRPPSDRNPKTYLRNLLLIGAGVLIVVFIVIFFRVSGKDNTHEILSQMEKRLTIIEQKIATLEKQQADLAGGTVKSLTEKVEMLEKRQTEKPKSPSPKAQAGSPAKRYHEVKKGETLSRIAKMYGLSPEKLRRMNKLPPKTAVVAGQRLIVGPGKKN